MSFHSVKKTANGMYNSRLKMIPDINGIYQPYEIFIFPDLIFNPNNVERESYIYESSENCDLYVDIIDGDISSSSTDNIRNNFNKSRRRLFDLIQCNNQLNMFVTLTIDSSKLNRIDYEEIIKKLNIWLDNRVRRNNMSYILVPELHKDGKSIHFHGVIKDTTLKLFNSGHRDKGKTIYNITDFPYGFTTAKRITTKNGYNSAEAIAKYTTKYMTKALKEYDNAISRGDEVLPKLKIGGRYYLSGGKLLKPKYKYANIDYSIVEKLPIKIENTNIQYKSIQKNDLTFLGLLKEMS